MTNPIHTDAELVTGAFAVPVPDENAYLKIVTGEADRDGRLPVANAGIQQDLTGLRVSLDGQVAVVTGASQGIGRAIAEVLASAGADIVLNHFGATAESVGQVTRRIREMGRAVVAIEADVASRAEVAAMVQRAFDEFGRIDILVNNAGISPECPLHEMTDDIWDRVLAVNLKGQFLVCQAVVPLMRSAGYGRIVNIASEQGLIGAVDMSAYCASKAGVFGLTKALARELAPAGILVNCVAPGPVDTAMLADRDRTSELTSRIPLGRIGRPEEIAFAVLLLASPQTSWTTGQVHSPNGGVVMQ